MKLLTASVRNYRIICNSGILRLDSPSGLAILGAPNESGKSTLIEAIHTCLFVAHRTDGKGFMGKIRPNPATGEPTTVELTFEATGGTYSIRKIFKGGKNSVAELTQPNGTKLAGDDAETKLAELTGHAAGNSANQELAWAHLWVWQGTAGDDPLGASLPKAKLDQRLAQEGAGGVFRSGDDSRVMAQVDELWGQVYTGTTNRVKATSDLHKAGEILKEVRSRQAKASAELALMEKDIIAKDDAQRRIDEAKRGLEKVEPEWALNQKQIGVLAERSREIEEANRKLENSNFELARLLKADRDITDKEIQVDALKKALEPADREVKRLLEQVRASEARQGELTVETNRASETEESTRQQRDLAQACADLLERKKNLARLEGVRIEAEALGSEIAELELELAGLPPVDDKTLARLNELEKKALLAEASLKAMALELEVVRADQSVSLGGEVVPPGTKVLVASRTELTLGEGVLIRLSPGGADSLAQTSQEAKRARLAFADELSKCQVESMALAGMVRNQRVELETKLAGARRQHKGMGVDKLAQDLADARRLKATSEAEKERRIGLVPGCVVPEGEGFLAWLEGSKDAAEKAQTACQRVNAEFQAVAKRVTELRATWGMANEALIRNEAELHDLSGGISELVSQHGNMVQRQQNLGNAKALQMGMENIVRTLDDQIKALNPETLESNTGRLKRSREQLAQQLEEANRQKSELDGKLSVFLTNDPRTDAKECMERLEVLQPEYQAKQTRAEGILLLKNEFQQAAQAVGQDVVRPLLERVNRLVRIVYGHGAEMQIAKAGENLGGLHLKRPDRGLQAFSTLSHGTREQVAGIFRLALAELLASDHDGCLPMVLDDSFVNADPERLQKLHSLLDAAASNGLQIILVSCDPLAHSTLGAKQIDLSAMTRNMKEAGTHGFAEASNDLPESDSADAQDEDSTTIAMAAVKPNSKGRKKRD